MLIRLSGQLDDSQPEAVPDRRARLVYAGTFQSMDGEVTLSVDQLSLLVKNHNAQLAQLGTNIAMADYPPVQVDHSTSAHDTVGRVVGPLELGTMEDGNTAIFCYIRFLGSENQEKAKDGRWTHLSVGADFDAGKLIEVTVTPFPAAQNACLLSKGVSDMDKGVRAKCLKYLSEKEGISEDEATAKLEAMNDEEKKELSSKLADEDNEEKTKLAAEEEEAKEKEKEKVEMTSAINSAVTKLQSVKLALRKQNIAGRIVRLRSQAKITPAEIRKIDFEELANTNDKTVEAVLKTYENREPVLLVGQYGTLKGMSPAELVEDIKKRDLEAEVRTYMTSLGSKSQAATRMEAGDQTVVERNREVPIDEDNLSTFDQIVRAIQANDLEGAKKLFSQYASPTDVVGGSSPGTESAMAALMSAFVELESQITTVTRLAGQRFGLQL